MSIQVKIVKAIDSDAESDFCHFILYQPGQFNKPLQIIDNYDVYTLIMDLLPGLSKATLADISQCITKLTGEMNDENV